jgi:type I restriction enzyme S subunit
MTLERFAQGSTFKEIRPPTLRKLRLLIPPKTEQAGIIQVLKSVDAAIKQSNALFGKLKHIKAGLMHDLLTRGLDRDGNLRDPVRHPKHFKDSPLGQLPVEWETFSFEQITVDDAPICYGIVQPGPFAEGGAPVLAIHNLNGNYLTNIHRSAQSIEKGYARSRVLPNDVLLSIKGTIGRVDIAPSWFSGNISRDIARIRLKPFASPSFVRHMLLAPAYQRRLELAVVGTTRPEISIGVLKQLKLPLPQIEEQQNIAAILDLQDACIRAEEANRNKLTAMKQGLMQDLLVGRKRVAALPSPNGTRL